LKKIVIAYNTVQYVVLFRTNLIRSLLRQGCVIYVIAPTDRYVEKLTELGCHHLHINIAGGINPLKDAKYFIDIYIILRRIRPEFFLGYTIKPNIFGSIACHLLGITVINNISGLGSAFIRDSFVTTIVKRLYRVALSGSSKIFFQNPDDFSYFNSLGIALEHQSEIIPGSGIDLSLYNYNDNHLFRKHDSFIFLFIGRLSLEKGVMEFLEASEVVKSSFPTAKFRVIGSFEHTNPSKIDKLLFERYVADGVIEYLGYVDDVKPHINNSDCVCLPSYREGTPRSLLEAAALGKPLIATDVPGCRQVVRDGYNGFLCDVRSSESLARTMLKLCSLSESSLRLLGRNSQRIVVSEYDEKIVLRAYFRAMSLTFPD
jgi:glycosyltransferase involved in cell wall biosynthesis